MTRAFVLLCIALVAFLSGGCEEKVRPSVVTMSSGRDLPMQESWNAKIIFTDSGRVTGILRAGYIARYGDRHLTQLDSGIVVDFFDEFEHHTSVLTAHRGRVDDATNNFEAHENVVVVSDSGTTLKTEELYWDNVIRKVHTPAFVEIASSAEQIQGHGFESDRGLKRYTIFRVTGQAKMNE